MRQLPRFHSKTKPHFFWPLQLSSIKYVLIVSGQVFNYLSFVCPTQNSLFLSSLLQPCWLQDTSWEEFLAVDTSSSNRQRVICSYGRWWCDRHIFHALIFPRGNHWGLAGRWCIRGRRKGRVYLLSPCHRELLRSIQLPAASAASAIQLFTSLPQLKWWVPAFPFR